MAIYILDGQWSSAPQVIESSGHDDVISARWQETPLSYSKHASGAENRLHVGAVDMRRGRAEDLSARFAMSASLPVQIASLSQDFHKDGIQHPRLSMWMSMLLFRTPKDATEGKVAPQPMACLAF